MPGGAVFGEVVFWIFAVISVFPGLMILLSQNIVRQAFWLLLSLSGFAGLYLCLGADFLGFIQVVVYIGGILILFLFGVMLTRKGDVPVKEISGLAVAIPGVVAGLVTIALLLYVVLATPWKEVPRGYPETASIIGQKVMSTYLLPFEVVSVVLLVALVGATCIARRKGGQAE